MSSLLSTWFYTCTGCLMAQLGAQQGRVGCRVLLTMQCTFPTRRPFKSHISFYLQSAPASGKAERQDERQKVRERGRAGGRAGETQPQQGALRSGRLMQKWENKEVYIGENRLWREKNPPKSPSVFPFNKKKHEKQACDGGMSLVVASSKCSAHLSSLDSFTFTLNSHFSS